MALVPNYVGRSAMTRPVAPTGPAPARAFGATPSMAPAAKSSSSPPPMVSTGTPPPPGPGPAVGRRRPAMSRPSMAAGRGGKFRYAGTKPAVVPGANR